MSPIGQSDQSRWTAVIPAAGRGSRLGYYMPKILYPVLGRPVIEWLVEGLTPWCHQFVFVVSPEGESFIAPAAAKLLGIRASCVVQNEPNGMADAIWSALPTVSSRSTLVVWGDQVTVDSATVGRTIALHHSRSNARLTMPTVVREHPYICFERDSTGILSRVAEAREGAVMPERGESDCGVFAFETADLRAVLGKARRDRLGMGNVTKELNLLPLLPLFQQGPESVVCFEIKDLDQALGVNSKQDGDAAEQILAARRAV
jgi:bifunctional UDP-N-acetylglucosamine pyrophosphorylase / glucosamine-1-phosphate N-acetyltransferase